MNETPELSLADEARQRRLLLALGIATFMVGLDGRVVAPLLPTIAADYETSIARASWLVSAYMLPYGVCQLAYGPLADRFGKVRVALYAMLAFSLGTALCGAFTSFALIVAMRVATGAAAAALIPLTIAYIGDTVPYTRRQAVLGMLIASSGAAQAFSTSAGGTLAVWVSWRRVFPLLGLLAALATLAIFLQRDSEIRLQNALGRTRSGYGDVLRSPGMPALLGLVFVEGFLYMGGFSFLSGLLEQRFALGPFAIGLVLGLAGVSQLTAARLLPWLLARLSEAELVALGGTSMTASFVLAAAAPHWGAVALGAALSGFGFSTCHSTLQTRATEVFPSGRGRALALFAFALFSGGGLGTLCIGYATDCFGYALSFALTAFSLGVFSVFGARFVANSGAALSPSP